MYRYVVVPEEAVAVGILSELALAETMKVQRNIHEDMKLISFDLQMRIKNYCEYKILMRINQVPVCA